MPHPLSAQRQVRIERRLAEIRLINDLDRRRYAIGEVRGREVMLARDEDQAQQIAQFPMLGYRVTMTDINLAMYHTVRLILTVHKDGVVVHRDRHFVTNPPLLMRDEEGDIYRPSGKGVLLRYTYHPIGAIAQTLVGNLILTNKI